jgi:hypothetical protein
MRRGPHTYYAYAKPERSLMEVMNTLAQAGVMTSADDVLREDDFVRTDTLAADLHRQYRTALKQQEKLIAENGTDDPMAEIAQDLAESARSALDTRLIELRREQEAVDRARRQQLSEKENQIRLRAQEKRETAMVLFYKLQMFERFRRKQKEQDSDATLMFMLMFFFFGMRPLPYVQPACSRSFNRLAA